MVILPILGQFRTILAHPGSKFLVTKDLKVLNTSHMNSMGWLMGDSNQNQHPRSSRLWNMVILPIWGHFGGIFGLFSPTQGQNFRWLIIWKCLIHYIWTLCGGKWGDTNQNKLPRSSSFWNMVILPILGQFRTILAHPGSKFLVTKDLKVLNTSHMNSMGWLMGDSNQNQHPRSSRLWNMVILPIWGHFGGIFGPFWPTQGQKFR